MTRVVSLLFLALVAGSMPRVVLATRVIFREADTGVPGWDHVGFEFAGNVWESHPGNDYFLGAAWDPLRGQYISVPNVSGVQHNHTRGSFGWNAFSKTVSPVSALAEISIDPNLASDMWDQALFVDGSPYVDYLDLLSVSASKGGSGTFSCVGLIEYLSESAGYNGGQGFIPNASEQLSVGPISITMLTPSTLYKAITNNWKPDDKRLRALADPVDFLVTDPLGRRVGYTEADGMLNEIPGMYYTGNGILEELILDNPANGAYTVKLVGLGAEALFAIGDGTGAGFAFDDFLAAGQIVNGNFTLGPTQTQPGDYNGNGVVEAADYVLWRNGGPLLNDATPGVQPADYDVWRAHFGQTAGSGADASLHTTVPEPAPLVMLMVAVVGGCLRGSRSRVLARVLIDHS